MDSVIMINGEVIGHIYGLSPANIIYPDVEADVCPAYSGEACSYYEGKCPYCGNTAECQREEERAGRPRPLQSYYKEQF